MENIRPIGEVCLVGQSCVGVKAELSINGVGSSTNELELSPIEEKPEDTQSEVNTNEPLGGEPDGFDVSAAYQTSCFACHASGAAAAGPPLPPGGARAHGGCTAAPSRAARARVWTTPLPTDTPPTNTPLTRV